MELRTRKMLDRSFTAIGVIAIVLMAASLVILLQPIVSRGTGAFVFRETVENRKLSLDQFGRGKPREARDRHHGDRGRQETGLRHAGIVRRGNGGGRPGLQKAVQERVFGAAGHACRTARALSGGQGAGPDRDRYGQTRWDRAQVKLHRILFMEEYDYSDPDRMGVKVEKPRAALFEATSLAPLFGYLEENLERMLRPRLTFYWRFLFDESIDAHFFGGIWPEMLGTFYLTFGAMLFAVPLGVIAAIYLAEYAGTGRFVSLLRTCISTLAGVPSIVFGLFGLAFFINTMRVANAKSVLAGSLTLALLVLPDRDPRLRGSDPRRAADVQGSGDEPGGGQLAHDRDGDPAGRAARNPDEHRHQRRPGGRRDGADHLHGRGQRGETARLLADAQPAHTGPVVEHL